MSPGFTRRFYPDINSSPSRTQEAIVLIALCFASLAAALPPRSATVMLASLATQAAPQAPAMPRPAARDAVPEKKGTAIIKGHVRSADGQVLRRAQIGVRGAALSNPRSASTGIEG